ncbi:MAG: hypothetical protein ACI4OZ_09135 [Akkermansia sp.]
MAEAGNGGVKGGRAQLAERLGSSYPDKDFSDDEVLYGQISEDYDNYDKRMKDYEAREKSLSDLFAKDRRSASFLLEWRDGGDPVLMLLKRFGPEIKEAIDDPDKQEEIAKANKVYLERVAQEKAFEEEYQKNLGETLAYLESLTQEGKLKEGEIDDAMAMLTGIVHDGVAGKFSAETIDFAIKALKHDSDMEFAARAGEVRGRNSKIKEQLRMSRKGDGTAQLDGQNNGGERRKEMPGLGALDNYGDGQQSIWERGGERRSRRG